MDSLQKMAVKIFRDSISATLGPEIDRIDIRPEKGIVKFIFKNNYWGIQLDPTNGAPLLIEKRRSDFIEDLHDGLYLIAFSERMVKQIKASYTTIMSLSLVLLIISGKWLWWGANILRRLRRSSPI